MSRAWSDDELVIAFALYCRTPFGRLHQSNPEIVAISGAIGRTASALAMKCCNFASLDPSHQARGVRGLGNASAADRTTFEAFRADMARLDAAAGAAASRLGVRQDEPSEGGADHAGQEDWRAPTEATRVVAVRRVQAAFRRAVLAAYDEKCAACALGMPELLTAGHIIPWAKDETRRADPSNGIAFCALHERAFDRGLFTVNDDLRIAVSARVRVREPGDVHRAALIEIEGSELRAPSRFGPDAEALAYHRSEVFVAA